MRKLTFPSTMQQAQPHSRFVDSFKKQFREQEARLLRERARQPPGAGAAERTCLVAVDTADGNFLGCLDVRLPFQSRDGACSVRPLAAAVAVQVLYGRQKLALVSSALLLYA